MLLRFLAWGIERMELPFTKRKTIKGRKSGVWFHSWWLDKWNKLRKGLGRDRTFGNCQHINGIENLAPRWDHLGNVRKGREEAELWWCSGAGVAVRRASEVKSNQERVGSWKPREECSRKGEIISYVKTLLREQVIKWALRSDCWIWLWGGHWWPW